MNTKFVFLNRIKKILKFPAFLRNDKTRIVSGKMSSGLVPHAQRNQWMPNYLGHNQLCYLTKLIEIC